MCDITKEHLLTPRRYMSNRLEVFAVPTKEEKQKDAVKTLSQIMLDFGIDEVEMVNNDSINFTIRVPATEDRISVFDTLNGGFSVSNSALSTVKHRYNDRTAVATNITLDKTQSPNSFLISLNF